MGTGSPLKLRLANIRDGLVDAFKQGKDNANYNAEKFTLCAKNALEEAFNLGKQIAAGKLDEEPKEEESKED